MRPCDAIRIPLLGAALFVAPLAGAQPTPRADDARGSWMLGLGMQVDENDSDSQLASLYVGVGASTWLTFVAGRSTSPADRADIRADTLSLGVDHSFDGVGFTLAAESWGESGALQTRDLGASLYFERDSWRVAVGYETRDIEIPFTLTGPLGGTVTRTAEVDADVVTLAGRVALGEAWRLYLGLAEHDYSRQLGLLPRIDRLNLLSASTLTLANGFLDSERYAAVEGDLSRVTLNFRVATDRSAIDGSKLDTVEAAVLIPLLGRVDLEINVGHGRSSSFDAGTYGGLLFLIYGG